MYATVLLLILVAHTRGMENDEVTESWYKNPPVESIIQDGDDADSVTVITPYEETGLGNAQSLIGSDMTASLFVSLETNKVEIEIPDEFEWYFKHEVKKNIPTDQSTNKTYGDELIEDSFIMSQAFLPAWWRYCADLVAIANGISFQDYDIGLGTGEIPESKFLV